MPLALKHSKRMFHRCQLHKIVFVAMSKIAYIAIFDVILLMSCLVHHNKMEDNLFGRVA